MNRGAEIFSKDWSNFWIDKETESSNSGQKKIIKFWSAY